MAQKGWKAKGLLQPLWNRYEGGRDALGAAVGTTGTVLSSVNSGKRSLGYDLAARLAAELHVTVLDLGAPEEAAAATRERRVIDRLRQLEEADARLLATVKSLTDRVEALEQQARPKRKRA